VNFLDLTGELLSKVDFDKSKIIQPRKLVFVCGGKKSGDSAAPTSMREVLLAKAEASGNRGEFGGVKVILAEAAVDYLAKSSFTNLLDLERYIAAVVHAVVLIVESPGSICELGAFVMAPEIRKKLIVVMQSEYQFRSSFITTGAIKYFEENETEAPVFGYHWLTDSNTRVITVEDFVVDEMLVALPAAIEAVHRVHAKEAFKDDQTGHLIFLTLAFCHILRAAKQIEIKQCFESVNIQILEKELKHYIDILVICDLIKPFTHGKLVFYVALVERSPLEIAFKEGTGKSDRNTARWITRIVDAINNDVDEKFRILMFKGVRNA
jgi:hypothetical protein